VKPMTIEKALNLLIEYNVPQHIILHSYKVTKVAYVITEELIEAGNNLNSQLITFSSLLHDITKYQAIINKGEDHSKTGGELLRDLGYPEVAEIIESHIIIKNKKRMLLEKMIVFYSDKRVKHDKVVSLKERYDDLIERYGRTIKSKLLIKEGFRRAKNIENKIFKNLNILPEHLNIL
jgi:putative nucleotidyltransferase with HDIG domain